MTGRARDEPARGRAPLARTAGGGRAGRGILVRAASSRGVAEEAPGAYKDVRAVVEAADAAGLSRRVARLEPVITIKG
jgi:tRNA-splicing ligase RtcB